MSDKFETFLYCLLGLCILAIPFIIIAEIKDNQEMEKQNCVRSGPEREVMVPVTIMSGNTPIVIPTPTTEYLYTCDDYPRWR